MIKLPSSSVRLPQGSPSPRRSVGKWSRGRLHEPWRGRCRGGPRVPLTGLGAGLRRSLATTVSVISPAALARTASRCLTASQAANPSEELRCLRLGIASFGPPGYGIAHNARPTSPFCLRSQGILTTHSQLGQLNTAIRIACSGCEYPNVATISRLVVLYTRLVTWEKTSIKARVAPDSV